MAQEKRFGIPGVPFPIGVEYYRPPTPKPEVWDATLRAFAPPDSTSCVRFPTGSGSSRARASTRWTTSISSSTPPPSTGSTSGSTFPRRRTAPAPTGCCASTRTCGSSTTSTSRSSRTPIRPMPRAPWSIASTTRRFAIWRGDFLRHAINRYKDRPNLLIWGIWDGRTCRRPGRLRAAASPATACTRWRDTRRGCESSSRWTNSMSRSTAASAAGRTSSRRAPTATSSRCAGTGASITRTSPTT